MPCKQKAFHVHLPDFIIYGGHYTNYQLSFQSIMDIMDLQLAQGLGGNGALGTGAMSAPF